MSEIDVTYCKFARLNDVCASPINKQECKCSKIPIQMCYYKQLQQLKDYIKEDLAPTCQRLQKENEELKDSLGLANKYLNKYKATLDEIEEVVTKYRVADSNLFMSMDIPNVRKIFEIIKQAKEGGE